MTMGHRTFQRRRVEDEQQERIRPILILVERIVGLPGGSDLRDPDERLLTAEHAVRDAIARARADGDGPRVVLLSALAEQVRFVQASLAQHNAIDTAMCEVRQALSRLRSITSTPDLVAEAPTELGRLGYTRVLVSRIQDGNWVTRSAYAQHSPELATKLVAAGRARPRLLNASLLETEMIRRRRTMFVGDAQSAPNTHQELVALTMTQAYVAAPLVSYGNAVGLLHADKNADAGRVSHLDQEVLGWFAEGFGLALEHTVSLHRLRSLRARLTAQLSTVTDLIDEFADAESLDLTDPDNTETPPHAHVLLLHPAGPRDWALTARECEVLRALAAGKTNAQIAAGLFVSEATVKYHVKNVLRKMRATNRADAVARYYQTR
jgi:DNA-binding CsgD family transcriptional regulator/GAF domain-containing protein